jgi:hypothetical protein
MLIYLSDLPVKIIINANMKNGVKTNNAPIHVINMIEPPNDLCGLRTAAL